MLWIWNLSPNYDYDHNKESWTREGWVVTHIWPDIAEGLYHSLQSTPDVEDAMSIIASLALIFLAAIQFLLAPLWQVICASRLLRFIPAGLCALGLLVILYFMIDELIPLHRSDYFRAVMLSLIALNFLITLLALLLYQPEPLLETET